MIFTRPEFDSIAATINPLPPQYILDQVFESLQELGQDYFLEKDPILKLSEEDIKLFAVVMTEIAEIYLLRMKRENLALKERLGLLE